MTRDAIIIMIEKEWRDRLKAAVEAEREACAKIADKYHIPMCDTVADAIAAAIRARKNT